MPEIKVGDTVSGIWLKDVPKGGIDIERVVVWHVNKYHVYAGGPGVCFHHEEIYAHWPKND